MKDTLANLGNSADAFAPRRCRQVGRVAVESQNLEDIGVVDRRREDLDPDLASAGGTRGLLDDFQDLCRITMLFKGHDLHQRLHRWFEGALVR